ncbi:hypothetical protein HUF15_00640 [Streptomyces samsunensis]|uniref:hypothetical protein n=1 Tax=Streptomyces malaysiensis TaxID=92644 RepID=UPI001582B386|nr:hypothetical protein [Streptomyces samsunensis]NUH35288.1 hypothetical protein [Streptomyces samsunensis]
MDQGWAAVIAGVVGLLGAGIGGYFAKKGAEVGAKTAADALAHQVERQAANELTHWVRQEQRQAHGEVAHAYGALAKTLADCRIAMNDGRNADDLLAQAAEQRSLLHIACSGTALFGPEAVWAAAQELSQAALETLKAHERLAFHSRGEGSASLAGVTEEMRASRTAVSDSLAAFSTACREAILGRSR